MNITGEVKFFLNQFFSHEFLQKNFQAFKCNCINCLKYLLLNRKTTNEIINEIILNDTTVYFENL